MLSHFGMENIKKKKKISSCFALLCLGIMNIMNEGPSFTTHAECGIVSQAF